MDEQGRAGTNRDARTDTDTSVHRSAALRCFCFEGVNLAVVLLQLLLIVDGAYHGG